ncbi:MAG: polysaccharide biosynthesis/export family protein [Verrucomicrobiota bacterium]
MTLSSVMSCAQRLALLLLVVASVFFSGCATDGTSAPPYQPTAGDPQVEIGETLGIGDPVRVTFHGTPTPVQPVEERVKDDGTINLPLIGSVKAVGKTRGELQREVQARYVPAYYAQGVVITVDPAERYFYVSGEVKIPSRQLYTPGMTVTKAIAAAGDFTVYAKKSRIEVIRANGRKERVDYKKALANPKLDLPIFPNDRVHVPKSPI